MKYRKEIDGLRAIAVLPVIFNHANLPFFSGGFIGVDIFFVTSGYLISRIIYDETGAGNFSLLKFYERRLRRIVPAIVPVIMACLVAGYFTMLPDSFENLAQSVIATILFSNNILLPLTGGYWDLASEFKPLLHTWSLGAEEQFYIFYPLLAVAILTLSRRLFPAFLVIGIVISLGLSILLTPIQPNASFYLLHTRAWELLLGALVAHLTLVPPNASPIGHALALIGLALIAASILFMSKATPYPSYWVVIPCLGTALILAFARDTSLAARILHFGPFVFIGLISYSAYLWHQPIFVFTRVMSISQPPVLLMLLLCAATLAVAYLSWRYVEQPFRNPSFLPKVQFCFALVVSSAVLFGMSGAVYLMSGLPQRVAGMGLAQGSFIAFNESAFRYKSDAFEETDQRRLLVLGDSNARDIINVIDASNLFRDFQIIYREDVSICMPSDNTDIGKSLLAKADAIIIVASYLFNVRCTTLDLGLPESAAKPLVLVGPKHFGYNLDAYIRVAPNARSDARAVLLSNTLSANKNYAQLAPNGSYLDLLAMMQTRFGGVPVFDAEGRILSADRVHLTKAGAAFFASFIFDDPVWQQVLSAPAPKGDGD